MANDKYEDWVHVKITDKELSDQLDAMVESDKRDRSKMVRWLIEQEWRRRNSQAHLFSINVTEPIPATLKAVAS